MSNWIAAHKAMLASIATVMVAASGAAPPPYSSYLFAAAVVLAALSGGPQPAAPAPDHAARILDLVERGLAPPPRK